MLGWLNKNVRAAEGGAGETRRTALRGDGVNYHL